VVPPVLLDYELTDIASRRNVDGQTHRAIANLKVADLISPIDFAINHAEFFVVSVKS
jgi:hypothetical protein